MKAAVLNEKGFHIIEKEIPVPGPGQVLVKTAGCGVCEGDLFRYIHRHELASMNFKGIQIGHEGSGVVTAVGPYVEHFSVGDRVTSLYGDYAEYFLAEASHLVHIPDGIKTHMALGEPVACCMAGAEHFGIALGDRVAVFGIGFMGLVTLQLARLQGASEVVVFDIIDWRLDKALAMGADRAVNNRERDAAALLAEYGEFDVFIEAAGVQAAIDVGTALTRKHGTLNLVGYHQSEGGKRSVDMKTWNYKALTVVNSHIRDDVHKRKLMADCLRLMAAGRLNIDALIANYDFANISRAFEDLAARKKGLLKANLVF